MPSISEQPTGVTEIGSGAAWQQSGGNLSDSQLADDDILAFSHRVGVGLTSVLQCYSFGFAVPEGDTIDGIELEWIKGTLVHGNSGIQDNKVRLFTGWPSEVYVGDDKADTVSAWPNNTNSPVNYGGPADAWNAGLTDTDVNDNGFGIEFIVEHTMSGDRFIISDKVTLTIYHSTGGGGGGVGPIPEGQDLYAMGIWGWGAGL